MKKKLRNLEVVETPEYMLEVDHHAQNLPSLIDGMTMICCVRDCGRGHAYGHGAQCGDRAALEELLTAIQEPLFRHVSRIVRNAALAEEALQETLMTVYRKLRWLHDPELLRPWAYRIATRQALQVLRHERRLFAEPLDETEEMGNVAAPPIEPLHVDLLPRLPDLVDPASPLSRAVLSMHYLDEMTLAEIAVALGVSVGTV